MMLEPEYYLFTKEDPLKTIRDDAKTLSIPRKMKLGAHIRRAEMHIRKSKDFRTVLQCENADLATVIASVFTLYFDSMIDKGNLVAIPSDPGLEFLSFFEKFCSSNAKTVDDKYMKKANSLILRYSESIDSFIKAFHSIRNTKAQLNKLQTK